MRIGIITGKDDEISLHKEANKLVPKKYYVNGNVQTDIALAYIMKQKFVGFTVDIITPKEITNQRLKKNDINFIIGYDVINVINDDPPVKKFSGQKGLEKLGYGWDSYDEKERYANIHFGLTPSQYKNIKKNSNILKLFSIFFIYLFHAQAASPLPILVSLLLSYPSHTAVVS